tara:strand:- start:63 stop:719 length:657 start_codon:yes stop_codon:yes gene_type:complete
MSNIKLVHSGGNSVSLTTPTNNPSSNVTFKLPQADGSAGQVLQTDGNGNLTFVNPPSGITEADTWRLNDSYGNTDSSTRIEDPIQNDLVRINQPIQGYLGTGMTVSSGIWTFPSTGYWLILAQVCMNGIANRESRYNGVTIMGTVNNSSYVDLSRGYTMFEDYSTSRFMTFTISTVCDITNVSTHKVKFKSTTLNNTRVIGDTDKEFTSFKFIRLGDT